MLLIPRGVALAIVSVSMITVLALGIFGYAELIDSGAEEQTKARAELLLFLGIVHATLLAAAFTFVARRTRNVSRELDKMNALNRYGDFSPEVSLRRFGGIGEKITHLYNRLDSLNEKRSLKISALSDLVQLLIGNVSRPLLVSSLSGDIMYANATGGSYLGKSRTELQSTNVETALDWVNFHEVVSRLERQRVSFDLESPGRETNVVPIYNRMQELSYVVWVLGQSSLEAVETEPVEPAAGRSRLWNALRSALASGSRSTDEPKE